MSTTSADPEIALPIPIVYAVNDVAAGQEPIGARLIVLAARSASLCRPSPGSA
jgi:hypothetical protein